VCPDPLLRIYNASGDLIASNDNWDEPENILMHDTTQAVGAFALQQDSADAALLLDLPAGAYTAQTIDTTGGEGEVLVEIYRVGAEDD
jgi:hypothetical protein